MQTFNFASGPTQLPANVLQDLQNAVVSYENTGIPLYSLPHRCKMSLALVGDTEFRLRTLLNIPHDYEVLWMQGGATSQFSTVPMNLLQTGEQGAYLNTGYWSTRAYNHAQEVADIVALDEDIDSVLSPDFQLDSHFKYLHLTPNESSEGIEFTRLPNTNVPIIADMSSTLLSRRIDISRYGIIYACCQKNLGSTGLTVVIIRKDLIQPVAEIPILYRYQEYQQKNSIVNTIPVPAFYVINRMLNWCEQQGGLAKLQQQNTEKAALLYQYINQSDLFDNTVPAAYRSITNIPFILKNDVLTDAFLFQCQAEGLLFLNGHWAIGGCRANLYNAMPLAGVTHLVDIMKQFEKTHG